MIWEERSRDLENLLDAGDHPTTTLANAAAYLYRNLERINWVGFYLFDGSKLYLGPFGGKPACTSIEIGKGVCGTAAQRQEIIVVDDVDQFPGHIVCDPDSQSEIVLPIIVSGKLYGVLDIDSAEKARFGESERSGLHRIAEIISRKLHISG